MNIPLSATEASVCREYASSRRQFLHAASIVALGSLGVGRLLGQEGGRGRGASRRMTLNLVGGAIGVEADQEEIIRLAKRYGFESVEARWGELNEPEAMAELLREAGLEWGTAGLSVDFRKDEETFEKGLAELLNVASNLEKAGVSRVSTYLMPSHQELTYLQNFEQHASRLRKVAEILRDHGLRLGLEYVGTRSLLVRNRYPFIHTLAEARELIESIGTGNVGLVLDSWHWWTAGDSVGAIRSLKNEDVILVDLNDAPKGIAKEDQLDNRRQLPASTGVIPIKEFLEALVAIDYDGPVRAEPFNQTLSDLDNDAACVATIGALRKAIGLIEG